jgi:hypothetical protein
MIAKPIVAVLLAALVAASGAAGSFYLASAQEQAAVEQAEITVADEAQAGSEIDISGSNFGANSDVSIYFMSAAQAELGNGSALILQELPANETTAAEAGGSNFFEDALNALSNLLGLSGEESDTTTTSSSNGSLLVVLDELASGAMSLECDNESIAESELRGTNLVKS